MYENRGFLPPRHVTYELAQYRLLGKLECLYSNKSSFQLACDRLVTCFKGVPILSLHFLPLLISTVVGSNPTLQMGTIRKLIYEVIGSYLSKWEKPINEHVFGLL